MCTFHDFTIWQITGSFWKVEQCRGLNNKAGPQMDTEFQLNEDS